MLMTHIHAENEGKVGSQDRVETSRWTDTRTVKLSCIFKKFSNLQFKWIHGTVDG